ncbi:MAG TPA: GNAT family N-acetyltransferase [Thermoanaerobaculia bacterium]|jgi:ribosomal protein S18 acetylase RimI-like enzyme|nr:GNAT family N-acetyltransferase [Thermoanaerobaculia bacterium]
MSLIAEAADANFLVHAAWVQSRVPGMTASSARGVTVVDSGLACDTFNCILAARLETAGTDAAIASALAHFGDVGRPFSWWVGPTDRPADLGMRLLAAGLAAAEGELAMSVELDAPRPDDVASVPGELAIERVATPAQLSDFAAVNAANWSPPDANVLRFYAAAASVLLSRESPFRCFVGRVGGEPVATLELAIGGGVGGIYNVATVARFRRRGFASAMMRRALDEARAAGLHAAVLQAAPDGVGVYRRLGFREFGRITEYKPR